MTTETRTVTIIGNNGVYGKQSIFPSVDFDHVPEAITATSRLEEKLVTTFWVLSKLMGETWIELQDVGDYINAIQRNPEQKPSLVNDDPAAAIGKEVYLAKFFDNPRTGGTDIFIKQEEDEYPKGEGRIKLSISLNSARVFLGGTEKWQEVADERYEQTLLSLLSKAQLQFTAHDDMAPWREAVREALKYREDESDGY